MMYDRETPFDTPQNSEPTPADVCGPYVSFRTRPAPADGWFVLQGLYPENAFGQYDPRGIFGSFKTIASFPSAEAANAAMARYFDALLGR